jgi:general secretion pathway protein B
MSFILDALKKSEAERQRRAGPALIEMRVVRPQRRIPVWVLVAGGLLLLGNVLFAVWLLSKPAAVSAPVPIATTIAATAPPATTPPSASAALPVAPGVAATPASGGLAPRPAIRSGGADENSYVVAGDTQNSVDTAESDAAPAESADGAGSSQLPRYADISAQLPSLRLDLHAYSAKAAERYAFINMRKVREGEITSEGMRVVAITRDGVELRYRDKQFLLERE